MSRVQLALNVSDLDAAVDFYSKLFATEPHKRRDGYANFAIAEPPLKLVLIESATATSGSINHLGVEVESTDEVTAATRRLAGEGFGTEVEDQVDCCFAVQDKVWVDGADGTKWEIYTILDDAGVSAPSSASDACGAGACCSTVDADAEVHASAALA